MKAADALRHALAEQGLKNFETGSWYGVLAPTGTPREIVTKLHAEIVKALKTPEAQNHFEHLGTDIIGNKPEEFAVQLRNEREKWAKPRAMPGSSRSDGVKRELCEFAQ